LIVDQEETSAVISPAESQEQAASQAFDGESRIKAMVMRLVGGESRASSESITVAGGKSRT
jgi:hypothetical protein